MAPRLLDQQSQSELGAFVRDVQLLQVRPQALDGVLGVSQLGQLMADVIDVLTGDFDGHVRSVAPLPTRNATQFSCGEGIA